MKESERFREFAEKFVLARAPDGTEGVWQAVLDAKTAYKQIEQATEEYARPERAIALAELEEKQRYIETVAQARRKELKHYAEGVIGTQPEDKRSWLSELSEHWHKDLAPSLDKQQMLEKAMERMKLPDPSNPKG